ncbi:MAG: DUF1361 domain-containing protein [Roseiflexaceae bacterium]|nr:DUF1361 domain-containing protein [Roseiflexaceae bacterium]
MNACFTRLRSDHALLVRFAFYPLFATSALACGLFVTRVILADGTSFRFLNWNLVLAWLPYAFAILAVRTHERAPGRWVRLLPIGGLWLLFFPNAPYLITDLVHLTAAVGAPWWYNLGMLMAYASAGSFLAVASLWAMHEIVRAYAGRLLGWLFVLAAIGLGGVGIYLGRFVRLNSWDIFTSPRVVAAHTLAALGDPQALLASGLFAALLLVLYLFTTVRRGAYVEPFAK